MMGYKEVVHQEINLRDSFQRVHKLRPLVPKPVTSPATSTNNINNSCFNFISLNNINNNHRDFGAKEVEERKEESTQVMVSSRWNPTPEQLMALEELYRCGTRTPSAEQIQHITTQLRRYGKIEGKNVFYWFQNHKARERQKRRRHLQHPVASTLTSTHPNNIRDVHQIHINGYCKDKADPGEAKLSTEVEQNSKWTSFVSKECEAPIKAADGPRKADMKRSEEFQHNYNQNNYICQNNFMFPAEKNATCPPHFSLSSTFLTSRSQDLNNTPTSVAINDNNNCDGINTAEDKIAAINDHEFVMTTSLTLQLFPVVPPDDLGESVANDLKKIPTDYLRVVDFISDGKGDCMVEDVGDDDEFVPYYQFL